MKITVRLVGRLGRRGPQGLQELSLAEGTTVAQVIESLGLRPGQVWMATVNGRYAEDDQCLQPGDEVVLVPPVGGGN